MTTDREQAMDAALDYLASLTRDGVDWVELLRCALPEADTTDMDAPAAEHQEWGKPR